MKLRNTPKASPRNGESRHRTSRGIRYDARSERCKKGRLAVASASSLTAVLAATLLLSSCSATVVPGPIPAPGVAFQHIHKLEAGQSDGGLLVAAHNGLYRVAFGTEGEATVEGPIGGFDFDFMGFAIAGDMTYASGHPGPNTTDDFGTPNLGLISSTDLGANWTNVSLTGVTDFHALTAAVDEKTNARVFGIDSSKQRIQRSLDGGQTWSEGAELVARDILAVGQQLYVTTSDGLAVSEDNGTSFDVDLAAPALFLVAADKSGQLAGIDIHGNVWIRGADGVWTTGGAVTGPPQALALEGKRIYVVDDRGIAFTEDKGSNWTVLTLRK